jgi:radical SAM superfamily enzyme YgiQ (UPF0313 family)
MPHVALVSFVGLRVREERLLQLGMSLPGLKKRASALAELPALGLLTLAGMTPPDWEQTYHEISSEQDAARVLDDLLFRRPTLVAVSALTASILSAYRFCDRLRESGVRVAIGGLHVTSCAEEAAEHADAVIVGEGESVWVTLLRDAEANCISGQYRASEAFCLEHSPLPRFDLLGSRSRPRYTLQTARGCPLACEFCGASRLLGQFRAKPLDRIRAELEALPSEQGLRWLELADDNTFVGARKPEPLLDLLKGANVRYFTESDWRLGERQDILRQLRESGCQQVLMGIESLHFRFPGMGQKQGELERVLDAVVAIQEAGVAVNGCFIVGADGETEASLDRLAEFLLASPFAELQLTLLTPFPGTPLYRRLVREGRILSRDWSHYTLFDLTYQPDKMSVEALEDGFVRLVSRVFSSGPSARREGIRRATWKGGRHRE